MRLQTSSVTASYIALSGAPNLHFLSFHLFMLRLSYLSPHTLWIITYVNNLSVTSFTFSKPVSLHKFLVCASFSVLYSCVSPFIRPR